MVIIVGIIIFLVACKIFARLLVSKGFFGDIANIIWWLYRVAWTLAIICFVVIMVTSLL